MKTLVWPPPGILGLGRSRTARRPDVPLDPIDGFTLVNHLAAAGIPLRVVQNRQVLHLYALAPTSTTDEVRALRAFSAVTDARLAWHKAVTS